MVKGGRMMALGSIIKPSWAGHVRIPAGLTTHSPSQNRVIEALRPTEMGNKGLAFKGWSGDGIGVSLILGFRVGIEPRLKLWL